MAINEDKRDISLDTLHDLMKNQKILSNRDMMLQNFGRLIENLTECENYLQAIIEGKQAKETSVARNMHQCLSLFTGDDMKVLESMMLTNFNDAMLTNNLAKLQMSQINLTEKINNLFSQSLNQYILSINQKFQNKQSINQNTSDSNQINSSSTQGKKKWAC